MDLTTLRLEVRERLGELSADFFTDVEVDRAINEAVKRFTAEEPWPWLVSTASGTVVAPATTLTLPNDVSLGRVFNLSAGRNSYTMFTLERLEASAGFRAKFRFVDGASDPSWYYVQSSSANDYVVRFVPHPASGVTWNYELLYHRVPATLSGGTDTPDMPEEYQEAVPAWATGKLWLKEFGVSNKASEQFSLYQKVVDQARKDTMTLQRDEDVAWGREMPESRFRTREDWLLGRIPPTLG